MEPTSVLQIIWLNWSGYSLSTWIFKNFPGGYDGQPYPWVTVSEGNLWGQTVWGTVCLLLRGFSEVLLIQSNDDLLFREATEIMKAAASHNHAVYTQRQRQRSASHARSWMAAAKPLLTFSWGNPRMHLTGNNATLCHIPNNWSKNALGCHQAHPMTCQK